MCKKNECVFIEAGYWVDKAKKIFKRNVFKPFDLIESIREERNNVGIFKTAYVYSSTKQNEAYLYGNFYLDFDSEDFELVREDVLRAISYLKIIFELKENEFRIFFSGNKGAHIIVDAISLGVEPDKDLNNIFKAIAKDINKFTKNKTLDLRIYDKKRLFRMPNSLHEKSGLYKVPLTYEMIRNSTESDIRKRASGKVSYEEFNNIANTKAKNVYKDYILNWKKEKLELESKAGNKENKLTYCPPCIEKILNIGADSGQRNNTIAILASYHYASGIDMKETNDILQKWNKEKNKKPVSQGEVANTIKSIYTGKVYFGCSTIIDLNLCENESNCKFLRKK